MMAQNQSPWTPEMNDELVARWATGDTMLQIAAQISTPKWKLSRSAISGQLSRLRYRLGDVVVPRRDPVRPPSGVRGKNRVPRKPKLAKPKKPVLKPVQRKDQHLATLTPKPKLIPFKSLPIAVLTPLREGVSIVEVTECRWAVGFDAKIPGGHTFCNAKRKWRSSYCDEHHAMMVRPQAIKE